MMTTDDASASAKQHEVERSRIIVGKRFGRFGVGWFLDGTYFGTPSSVEFSWQKCLDREERRSDVVGIFHTHPPNLLRPSSRDKKTLRAWIRCFGKPLLAEIRSGRKRAVWIFAEESHTKIWSIRIGPLLIWKGGANGPNVRS